MIFEPNYDFSSFAPREKIGAYRRCSNVDVSYFYFHVKMMTARVAFASRGFQTFLSHSGHDDVKDVYMGK